MINVNRSEQKLFEHFLGEIKFLSNGAKIHNITHEPMQYYLK